MWCNTLEIAFEPRQRATAADAGDDRVYTVLHLLPDLGSRGALVRLRIGGIAELVHVERVGRLARQPGGHVLIVLRMAVHDVGARHDDFRAHGPQVKNLLLAHLVGDHQQQAVAFAHGDER